MRWDWRRAAPRSSSTTSARDGEPSEASRKVAREIEAAGGAAMANGADVANADQVAAMVEAAHARWGGVDILVNNAGILRDKTFAKMELADFELVLSVHLLGSAICAKAVWAGMRERNYGRVLFTSSASGVYGNFGQANYGAAKAGMIGLMNVLHLEGAKNNIRVNTLLPTAATGMTEGLIPAGNGGADGPGNGDAGRAVPGQRGRAFAKSSSAPAPASSPSPISRRRRRVSRQGRAHAGDDRRALCGNRRPPKRPARSTTRSARLSNSSRPPPGRSASNCHNQEPPDARSRYRLDCAHADRAGLSRRVQRHARPRRSAAMRSKHAVKRAGVDPAEIDDVVMGAAMQQGSTYMNVARQAALRAGLPTSVAGMSVDRQCASGLMAIAIAAKQIVCDGMQTTVGGGLESISLVQNEHANRIARKIPGSSPIATMST